MSQLWLIITTLVLSARPSVAHTVIPHPLEGSSPLLQPLLSPPLPSPISAICGATFPRPVFPTVTSWAPATASPTRSAGPPASGGPPPPGCPRGLPDTGLVVSLPTAGRHSDPWAGGPDDSQYRSVPPAWHLPVTPQASLTHILSRPLPRSQLV